MTSEYLDRPVRTFEQACNDAIAAPLKRARPHEPADLYINVFQDVKRPDWMNGEQAFTEITEAYEGILDGQRGGNYRYTLHVKCAADGSRTSEVIHLEDEARAWRRS